MPVPILKQRDYLIASIQAALNDEELKKLREALVAQVGEFRSRGVIVDITAWTWSTPSRSARCATSPT